MGNPVVQHNGNHLDLVARDGVPSLVHEGALHRGGVEDHRRGGSGLAGNFDTGPDRVQVSDRCTTGDKDKVGGAGGDQRRICGMRRGVDDGEVGPGIACGCEQGRELVRLARDDGWGISDAETRPRRGRTLWVDVHQCCGEPCSLTGDGKAARERCLSCPTLTLMSATVNTGYQYTILNKIYIYTG